MLKKVCRLAALALALALPLAACDDAGGLAGGDSGQLSLLLTDAPGDFEAAVVTISGIYLQGDEGEEDAGRVVLLDEPVTTDLLTLSNDVAELVGEAIVPVGTYGQLRFIIAGGYILVEDGDGALDLYATPGYSPPAALAPPADAEDAGTLKCPSCQQTGIKVILPGGGLTVTSESKILLVDFDVSQTFGQQAGASGLWVMRPALEATEVELSAGIDVAVQLADTVTLPTVDGAQVTLGDFSAVLKAADAEEGAPGEAIALTDADGDGIFEANFDFVVPGEFTVGLQAPEGVTFTSAPATPQSVSVASGATADVDFTVTSAGKATTSGSSGG